jgi:hypothetical protein
MVTKNSSDMHLAHWFCNASPSKTKHRCSVSFVRTVRQQLREDVSGCAAVSVNALGGGRFTIRMQSEWYKAVQVQHPESFNEPQCSRGELRRTLT